MMLKSLRLQKDLALLLSNLKSGDIIDWNNWNFIPIKQICDFYIENGYCEKKESDLSQYEAFNTSILRTEKERNAMLTALINSSGDVRDFLIVHSHIDPDRHSYMNKYMDDNTIWLNDMMEKLLEPSDDDIERLYTKHSVPQDMLDKLSIFDPEILGIEKEDIEVRYNFSARNPINVIDLGWKRANPQMFSNVKKEISRYKPINVLTHGSNAEKLPCHDFEEDGLPF